MDRPYASACISVTIKYNLSHFCKCTTCSAANAAAIATAELLHPTPIPPRVHVILRSQTHRAYEKEDDFADWSRSGSSEGDDYGDVNNDWDSYDDYGDDDDEEAVASGSLSDQGGYLSGSGSYSQEEEGELWSDNGDGYDGENMGGDSWDDDGSDTPAAPKSSRRSRAGGAAPSRRPRPSAWTGDGSRTTGRRSSGSSAVARYQRGRRPAPTTRGFAVRMPAVSGAAIASALRRQMGTAREAVGQAGSIAASTSKKLKREVRARGICGTAGRGGSR